MHWLTQGASGGETKSLQWHHPVGYDLLFWEVECITMETKFPVLQRESCWDGKIPKMKMLLFVFLAGDCFGNLIPEVEAVLIKVHPDLVPARTDLTKWKWHMNSEGFPASCYYNEATIKPAPLLMIIMILAPRRPASYKTDNETWDKQRFSRGKLKLELLT